MVSISIRTFPARLTGVIATYLVAATACAPVRREPRVPRTAPPERVEAITSLRGVALRPVPERLLGPVVYDLPLVANSWVESEMSFLTSNRRDVLRHWMERGDHYEPFVRSVFAEYGIPTDLHHIGMIESGFIPTARSPAGAVGIWQFMPATAREVGLRVDNTVDERMDPVRSTRAAARHLRSLYRIYGDWDLALAAYNAGSGRISRGLQQVGATNFWQLAQRGDLAAETQLYVPRLYAMTIIARDRQRFGFEPSGPVEPFSFDSIHVDLSVTLGELSEMTGLDGDVLSRFNPHLRRGLTPDGGYWIWVPPGTAAGAQRSYIAAARDRERVVDYTVRWGDSLSRIAQRSGVPSARIRDLNPSIDFDRLLAGATIRLPAIGRDRLLGYSADRGSESGPVALATVARTGGSGGSGGARVHRVRAGDTLSEIARDYGVSVAAIRNANSLRSDLIRTGQRLTIPGSAASGSASVEHVVVAGDTLWDIARRYGTSVEAIRRVNGLGQRPIIPGQRLEVPTSRR